MGAIGLLHVKEPRQLEQHTAAIDARAPSGELLEGLARGLGIAARGGQLELAPDREGPRLRLGRGLLEEARGGVRIAGALGGLRGGQGDAAPRAQALEIAAERALEERERRREAALQGEAL